ncbi:MAG: hypothetical protein QG599_522 [Pseudomonadota bacterium]|nr:hypothetical protein [Pseudomonadota bacterium]
MMHESTPISPALEEPSGAKTAAYQDFDSLWKEAISAYFQPFMHLFFPQVSNEIDWRLARRPV